MSERSPVPNRWLLRCEEFLYSKRARGEPVEIFENLMLNCTGKNP